MSTTPAAVARTHRAKTGTVLAFAAAAITAAALLGPAGRRAAPPAPRQAIGMSASMVSGQILAGPAETHLAIGLVAPDAPSSRRSPASIAIVFDRSGSMRGAALEQAKAAAVALVDRLAPDDEIALISYASYVTVDVPLTVADAGGKAALRRAIGALVADGSTNTAAALEESGRALARAHNGVRRLMLMSDGKPTRADGRPMDPGQARAELLTVATQRAAAGVSISTLGFGVEYDEQVMTAVASAARGNYYYAGPGADLASMFVAELDSLGQTVIADSDLRIVPRPGVQITDVLGYQFQRDGAGAVTVPVTDLRAAARQKVVVAVRTELAPSAATVIATVEWRFRVVGGGTELRTMDIRAAVTADAGAVTASRDAATTRMVEEARTAMAIDAAAGAYGDGDVTRARVILETRAAEAAALGDAELERSLRRYTDDAQRSFAAPPPSAAAGKASVKGQRAGAWDLAH